MRGMPGTQYVTSEYVLIPWKKQERKGKQQQQIPPRATTIGSRKRNKFCRLPTQHHTESVPKTTTATTTAATTTTKNGTMTCQGQKWSSAEKIELEFESGCEFELGCELGFDFQFRFCWDAATNTACQKQEWSSTPGTSRTGLRQGAPSTRHPVGEGEKGKRVGARIHMKTADPMSKAVGCQIMNRWCTPGEKGRGRLLTKYANGSNNRAPAKTHTMGVPF